MVFYSLSIDYVYGRGVVLTIPLLHTVRKVQRENNTLLGMECYTHSLVCSSCKFLIIKFHIFITSDSVSVHHMESLLPQTTPYLLDIDRGKRQVVYFVEG